MIANPSRNPTRLNQETRGVLSLRLSRCSNLPTSTITCQIAYLTPPFGYNLFLMKAMAPKDFTIADIYQSVWPFVGVMILGLILVMIFPQIALYLPRVYFGLGK